MKVGSVLRPVMAGMLGLCLGLMVTWAAGEAPWRVMQVLGRGAAGSAYDFGMTLFYTTPLIFTGLSVAVAFHAGLFNVGAEGQLVAGALSAAAVGAIWPGLPAPVAPVLATGAAVLGGALWGFIPGWLRVRRGSHEVINTIMLNFIAAGLASYVTLRWLKNPASQNPETRPVGAGYLLAPFGCFGGAPIGLALPVALGAAVAIYVLLSKTVFGFKLRAAGENESAAQSAGIGVSAVRVAAFALAGGLAGLVGVSEVLGNGGKFRLGFSPEYGFTGIAVALLARNNPLGVVPAALLFGALHKGATDLDIETDHVTREVGLLFQGLILLAVSAEGLWSWQRRGPRGAESRPQAQGPEPAEASAQEVAP